MVRHGTIWDKSFLFLVLTLSAYFTGVESVCSVDCDGSGGTVKGTICEFEVVEELPVGTVVIHLESDDCTEFQLDNDNAKTYFSTIGANITVNKVVDYEEDTENLPGPIFFGLQCEGGEDCTWGNDEFAVQYVNINDNAINVTEESSAARVVELVKYYSGEPIDVIPAIYATDADVESFLLYSIADNQTYFKLEDGSGGEACFKTYDNNGQLITTKPVLTVQNDLTFDYGVTSSFQLTVLIQSFLGGSSRCSEQAVDNITYPLTVLVEDLDDQPPAFNQTLYDCTVEENSLTFISPPYVYAFDQDEGINDPILYSLKAQEVEWDCSSYVQIDESSGDVSILQPFNFEDNSVCRLILRAEQTSNKFRFSTAELKINIRDTNDNCPMFEETSLRGTYIKGDSFVSDDTKQDWLRLTLTDADPTLEYTDIWTESIYFEEKSVSCPGKCFQISPIDANSESLESENITVTVTDTFCECVSESCNRNNTVTIEIIIPEEPEILNPAFELSEYSATIDENETGYLIQVTALNGDSTTEGIKYSLPDPDDVFFFINESGHIHVLVGLDYETSQIFFVEVKATDGRWADVERYATVVVNVTVSDINDNSPILEGFPLFLYVSESTPSGTVISTLKASDRDAGSTLAYNFENTPISFPFTLETDTGEISTSSALDADSENERQYNATVIASDGMNTTPPQDLIITVLDVNDNPPVMSSDSHFRLNISENDVGPQKLVVTVTDNDYLEINKNYNLSSDGGSNVTVSQDTGEVYVTGPFNREVSSEFQFTLTVINTASPFWETSENVVVSILDTNDEFPTFTKETELYCTQLTVTEENIPAQPLCIFTATDADENGSDNSKITYEVDSEEYVSMDKDTGELSLIEPLDRETAGNVSFRVVASDNGEPPKSDSIVVTVFIEGVNDNRPFFKSDENYTTMVHEETTPNALILNIMADDIDVPTQDPIYYKPVNESDQVWETFYLRSENGECEIYLKSALNLRESPYQLHIETYDGDSSASYAEGPNNGTVVIVVVEPRVACNISLDGEYRETIRESDLLNSTTVIDLNVSSSCSMSEDGIVYSIEDQVLQPLEGSTTESSFFIVNEGSGEIYAENVNTVEIGMYVLTVSAFNETGSDLDQSEISSQVYINVTDVNNKCPYFEGTEYFARYTEGDAFLSSVSSPQWLVVTAIDEDTQFTGEVMFSDETTFTENTTELSSSRSFIIAVNEDLSTNTALNITVSDDTSVIICDPSITTIYITVEEYLSPVFLNESYLTSLYENPEVGDLVIEVTAQNADGTMEDISYAIESPSNTPFIIPDALIGEIVVAFEGIDYEAVKSYNLTVSATDNRWDVARSSTTQVLITIEDLNEFEPEFLGLPATINIQESVETGSEVFILKASDGDTEDNKILTYRLSGGGDAKFDVNTTSGSVFTTDIIDFEVDRLEYALNVSVSDGKYESYGELTIQILDVNDNAPKFIQESFSENITENQSPVYFNAGASDADSIDTLSYRLSGSYPSGAYVNETGFVIFTEMFDTEKQEFYSFFVIASDNKFETSAVIKIRVMDENDEVPVFVSLCNGRVDLKEDEEVGAPVCNISAVDDDVLRSNSIITYKLLDADGGPFDIDTSSGQIFLTERLNFEATKSYALKVQAGDGMDGTENKVNGSLEVFVLDVNDNPPVFDAHPSSITLIFDLAIGSQVSKLLVSDADETPFNSFLCEKTDNNNLSWDTFYLTTMRDGCSVMLGAVLNTSIDYTLGIMAVDTANASLTAATQLEITVRNTYPCEINLYVEDVMLDKTEVTIGETVADVQATSNCSDSEDGIIFTILSQQFTSPLGDTDGFSEEFDVTESSGAIFYDGSTEFPSVGEHVLVVEAVNDSDDVVRANTQFVITIEDVDVSDPELPDPPQIPNNPDPSSTSVFVGRFDEGDEYVFNYEDTSKLIITANDNDTCFSGNIEVLKPSTTPFYLEVTSHRSCFESFEAYLRVNGTWRDIQNVTTFQIALFDSNNTEIGIGNVTVAKLPLSPVFQESPMATVVENADVGDNVTMVIALNNDGTTDGIQYKIASETAFFEILDPGSGIITVKSVGIDYESREFYNISLFAEDTRWIPSRTTDTVVRVNVIDLDEFEPVLSPFPRITIQENVALAGATIYRIQAFDSDASSNLEYYLENNTETFNVTRDSGDVMLVSSIDAETDPLTYYVNVSVTDGDNVVSDILFVEITDFNEFPPNITGESKVEMYENDTSATAQVTAYDPDISRLPIQYSIDPSDSIASIDIDGLITFQGKLNYAEQSSYNFIILAEEESDEGLFSSVFEVTLEVLDINDHDPELVQDCEENEVLEGPDSVMKVFCTLSATDQDAATTFTYFLLNSFNEMFKLDAMTGELIVAEELDRETGEDYTLEVLVNDGGTPSRNSSITEINVKVGDVNDNAPEFVSPPSRPVIVGEDISARTMVAQLTVMDKDVFPYNISRCERTNNKDTAWNNFTILNDRVGYCEIITLAALSAPSSYTLNVSVIDLNQEDMFTNTIVMVEVIEDAACQLTIIVDSPVEFDEGQLGPGSEVTTVNASSICSTNADDIAFDITEQTLEDPYGNKEEVGVFEIDNTGVISVNSSADVSLGQYTLMVTAYNTSMPMSSDTNELVIVVNDINNKCPTFLMDSDEGIFAQGDEFIYDDESPGRLVIVAEDPDLEFSGNFTVNSTDFDVVETRYDASTVQLELSVVSPFDGNVTVRVMVDDTSISCPSDVIDISIYEIPVEELSPIFLNPELFNGTVWENATAGTNITQVTAVDMQGDSSGITYSFAEEDSYFSIAPDSGVITTGNRGLDYETENSFIKLVLASDGKWDPPRISEIYVTIKVLDINEYLLELAEIPTLRVPENTPADTLVYTAWATDADGSSSFVFSLEDPMNTFKIDQGSGEMYTSLKLDAEVTAYYTIIVTVTEESSSLSDSQTVDIDITDVNDFPPVFTQPEYSTMVSENFEGIRWIMVNATDDDLTSDNNVISYTLESDVDSRFSVDSELGNITINTTTNPFDSELQESYQFLVIASDNGNPTFSTSVMVFVIVEDENDNPPKFPDSLPDPLPVNFEEGMTGVIETFHATDIDDDMNAIITYSLSVVDDDSEGLFNINGDGELSAVQELDREDMATHFLNVYATDSGSPQLNASIGVIITVQDINDNPPVFRPPFAAVIEASLPVGSEILQISATDEDESPNDVIIFTSGNSSSDVWKTFALQSNDDGTSIILISQLDVESSQTYNFDVKASNLNGEQVVTQEYTIVANDGTLCFVTVEVPSGGTEKTNQGGLEQDVAFLKLNATSSTGCDEDEFIFVMNSQLYRGFEDKEFVSDTTFYLSTEGELFPNVTTVPTGEYQIVVSAVNKSNPEEQLSISESQITIVVVDDVNTAPYFTEEYSRNIRLPKELGDILFKLSAGDLDDISTGNDQLVFEKLFESNVDTETSYFRVEDNGDVVADKNLLTNDIVNLTVQVTDSGIPPLSDTTTIQIKLAMDAAPVLEPVPGTVVMIEENVPLGTFVCEVVSTGEEDVSFTLTYGSPQFVIDNGGVITTNEEFDYEVTQEYQVIVKAEGIESKLSTEIQILVKITDINEHSPNLQDIYFFSLLEDSGDISSDSCYVEFGFIRATDADGSEENSFIAYSLEGDSRFEINNTTGVIFKTGCVDVDDTSEDREINLTLRAVNSQANPQLEDTAVVNIIIADVNDNSPVLILNGDQDIVRQEFVPEEELFQFDYSDHDISGSNRKSNYSFEPSIEDYLVFDTKEGKISTGTQPPLPGTEIAVLVKIINTATPMLSDSMTVLYRYIEGSFFPDELLTQSVRVDENDNGAVEIDVLGPVGSLPGTQYSVFDIDGSCMEDFTAEYKSDTYLRLITNGLDFEVPEDRVLNVTIAFSSDGDNCATVRRKKRQTSALAANDASFVTINLVNVNDEPPKFSNFPLGPDSSNYYQAIHVSRVVGEIVYDLSQDAGRVVDLDEMPTTLTYAGQSELVNVSSDGSVVLKKFLNSGDANDETEDVSVTVTDVEQVGTAAATLRLRVMTDSDLFILWFPWTMDGDDQDLLQCVQQCFPDDKHVFSERVEKSETQNSALWLYAVDDGTLTENEDFIKRTQFVETWNGAECSKTCYLEVNLIKEKIRWTYIQIAIFSLAVLIFIGAIIFILILFYSYSVYEREMERHTDIQEAPPSIESEDSFRAAVVPLARGESIFDKIAREKNTALYGSDEAILDLISEADVLSVNGKFMVEVSPLPNGVLNMEATEGGAEKDDDNDNDDHVEPYSTFSFDPTQKDKIPLAKSAPVLAPEATTTSDTSMLAGILAEYDNKAFENDEQPPQVDVEEDGLSPGVNIHHEGETSTDAFINQTSDDRDKTGDESAVRVASDADVAPAVKEESDQVPKEDEGNDIILKDAKNGTQKHGGGTDGHTGSSDKSVPTTSL